MPGPYQRHVFVCTNERPDGHARGCCAARGADDVRAALKLAVSQRGLKGRVRANAAGCLDSCERGVSVVVYPEAVWYQGVTVADVDEIVVEHLIGGRPVTRLQWSGPEVLPPLPPT